MVVDKSGTWFLMRRGDCAGSAGVAEPKAAASWCTPATQWLHQPPRILFSTGVGLPPHSKMSGCPAMTVSSLESIKSHK